MERYDDRPISVYDNLSMPTTAPATTTVTAQTSAPNKYKQQQQQQTTSSATVSVPPTTATTAFASETPQHAHHSPYADITFKFNDNIKPQQQQQQLLPNGNRSLKQTELQSNPYNRTSHTSPTLSPIRPILTTNTTTSIKMPANNAATTTSMMHASPAQQVQRPLSQHSQSELNEASQSIAAVKAALNDAKSKFFGLNGYSQQSNLTDNSNNSPTDESQIYRLLPTSSIAQHTPKVQIVTYKPAAGSPPTPPPKPKPKYQNIPENSAIYRQQHHQPPELPPKPKEEQYQQQQHNNGDNKLTPIRITAVPIYNSNLPIELTEFITQTPTPTKMSATSSPASPQQQITTTPPSATTTPATTSPFSQYQQIPLSDLDSSQPSQAVYMSTTVPQNIKGAKIAGRHTPTRNSLRHSRMLVVNNKNYQGTSFPNPMNFKHPILTRWLLILEIIIGLLISFLAVWIFILAPNTAIQDNPYWSGLALLLAGIIGLVLVRYKRIKRHKVRENCFQFLRADSYLLSLAALLLCSVALTCATLHLVRLTAPDTKCVSTNMLLAHGSCTCKFNANMEELENDLKINSSANAVEEKIGDISASLDDVDDDHSYDVEYGDLSCAEVRGVWTCMLGFSIALNTLGFIVALLYILLLICCRHQERVYTSVQTSTF